MAQFTSIGKDGKPYNVEASSQQEADAILMAAMDDPSNYSEPPAQATQAQFPEGTETLDIPETGGRLYRTPDGQVGYVDPTYSTTDPLIIQRIQTGEPLESILGQGFQESAIQRNPALARAVTYGAGLPFVGEYIDEMAGMMSGPEAETGAKTLRTAMEEQRPVESIAGQVATGVATTAPMGTLMPAQTTTRLGRAIERGVQGGVFGGIEGGVSGYGAGTTPEERADIAKERGLFGLALGAPLGAGGGLIEGAYEAARRVNITDLSRELGISDDAATIIMREAMSGSSAADIDKRLSDMGSSARLANAGPAAKNLLDIIQAQSPQALETVTAGVRQAGREIRSEFDQSMDDLLGQAPIGPKAVFQEIRERTAPERDRLYNEAYTSIINYGSEKGEELLSVINRVPERYLEEAAQKANDLIQIEGLFVPQIKVVERNGRKVIEEQPNIIQLDYLKRGLNDIVMDNTDNITREISSEGMNARRLSADLNNALQNISPAYKKAVEAGFDTIQESEATRLMMNFNKSRFEDWRNLIVRASGETRQQIKESMKKMLRSNIQESLDNARATLQNPESTAESVNAALKVFKDYTTGAARNKLRLLMNGEEFRAFNQQMKKIGEQLDLQSKTARGSQTALRTQGAERVARVAEPGVVDLATSGEIASAGRQAIKSIIGPIADDDIELMNILNEVGSSLLQRRGDAEARRIAGIIRRIRDNEPVTAQEAQQAGQVIQSYIRSGIYEPAQQTTD